MIKVTWHKAASPPHTDGSAIFARLRQVANVHPHLIHVSLDPLRVTDVSRTVTFPDRRFPDKTFPGQDLSRIIIFPDKTFPGKTFPGRLRALTRRLFRVQDVCFPDNHFPGQTLPGQTFPGKFVHIILNTLVCSCKKTRRSDYATNISNISGTRKSNLSDL